MAIEERYVTGFAASNGLVNTDLIMIVANVGTANANNRKITVANFFGNLNVNVAGSFSLTTTGRTTTNTLIVNYSETPANNSNYPSAHRHLWWDEFYLYVVTQPGNIIKKVALNAL